MILEVQASLPALAVISECTPAASLQRLANGYRSALLRAPASGEARSVA